MSNIASEMDCLRYIVIFYLRSVMIRIIDILNLYQRHLVIRSSKALKRETTLLSPSREGDMTNYLPPRDEPLTNEIDCIILKG
jgi:hypothetical protein